MGNNKTHLQLESTTAELLRWKKQHRNKWVCALPAAQVQWPWVLLANQFNGRVTVEGLTNKTRGWVQQITVGLQGCSRANISSLLLSAGRNFSNTFKWAVLSAFLRGPLSFLLKHSTADASNSLAGMQIPSKLWTDTGLYKGQIFPCLPCLWFNLDKLTANHFVSSEVLFNASPEEKEKTPNPNQPPLTPEIFSWQTALICKLTAQKPLLNVQFSKNIFPSLAWWQALFYISAVCGVLAIRFRLGVCKVFQAQQNSRWLMAFSGLQVLEPQRTLDQHSLTKSRKW